MTTKKNTKTTGSKDAKKAKKNTKTTGSKDAKKAKETTKGKKAAVEPEVHEDTSLVVAGEALPDYLNPDSNRGSENVGTEDLVIPRVDVLQDGSPALKAKNEDAYIEGSNAGDLFNTVTRELYTDGVHFVPVFFKKEWLIWKDRDQGGGFRGAYDSKEEAIEALVKIKEEDEQGIFDIVDTAQHIVILVHMDGRVEEACLSMAKTKQKVSRQLNSIIRLSPGDSFAGLYKLTAVEASNAKGDDYFNFHVARVGFPQERIYKRAEKLYEDITSGAINVQADQNFEDEAMEGETSETKSDGTGKSF